MRIIMSALLIPFSLLGLLAMELPGPGPLDDPILGGVQAAAPATYGDEVGFRQRAEAIIRATAALDMAPYRRGHWLTGGDPGTYTLPIAIARLSAGQGVEEALRIVNDERSARESYHFAAMGWSRLIPLFHDRINEGTRRSLTGIPGNWLNGRGTDNHEVMWRGAALTLSSYRGGNARGLDWLQTYTRTLIAAGQAEWDSPRYQPYVLASLLNVYDFSQDQRARAWAKAALDYIAVAYALRRVGNIYAGPSSRGNSHSPSSDNMNAIGWLWWGGPGGAPSSSGNLRPALFAATSRYRPPEVIGRIARRELPQLPFTVEQGIANYWTGLDGPTLPVIANEGHATIWISRHITLGTAWYADDVCSQMIHLRAAASNQDGSNALSIIGGWPGLKDGKRTLYEGHCAVFGRRNNPQNHPYVSARHGQFAQVENLSVCLAEFPAGTPDPWTYVTTYGRVEQRQGWYVFSMGAATAAVFPLGEAETAREGNDQLIRIRGARSGFVLAVWDDTALQAAGVPNAMERIAVDASRWQAEQRIGLRTLSGQTAVVTRRPGQHFPAVTIGDAPVPRDRMYRSIYVNSVQSQLAISDGQQGYIIDVSGEVPRYRPLAGMPGAEAATEGRPRPQRPERPERPVPSSRAAASAPDEAQVTAWRDEVVALTAAALAAGHTPRFTHGRLGDTEVPEVQDGRLVLSARGARMAMPATSLGPAELASLAADLVKQGGMRAHALHAAFLRLSGERGLPYQQALRAAGDYATDVLEAWE
ncbi:MAG: hypothetical protein EA402_13505 [Planctomycetota bacterium]|nr:MAG: hypothetical protein EA402_13505 [Planctomycetota bacterium]